jgi:hypothetical protein
LGYNVLMETISDPHTEAIRKHYECVWGTAGESVDLRGGRRDELPSAFTVLEFPPRAERGMWTYATCGMSLPEDAELLELHLFSLEKSLEPVELLYVTAHFHRTGSKLGLGHTVNFGKPWMGSSPSQYGLVSLPYLDGPDLEDLVLDAARVAKFLWLIPVTHAEVQFKKQHGLEALEQKFEGGDFEYADPLRSSVV